MSNHLPLAQRIFLSFASVVILLGLFTALLTTRLVSGSVVREAQNRVTMNLRAARALYQQELEARLTTLEVLANRPLIVTILKGDETPHGLQKTLQDRRQQLNMDFLSVCDSDGRVLLRTRPQYQSGDTVASMLVVRRALEGYATPGTVLLSAEALAQEGRGLAEQAFVLFLPTPRAKPRVDSVETSGLCMMAAVPVLDPESGKVLGAIYGGSLLTRNFPLIDRIRDLVFEAREYKGKEFGTVTIFQRDVRVATNVLRPDGTRAIGTRVSAEVFNRVFGHGRPWLDRAFVVHDWYISAYEPIRDPKDRIVGIFYVGLLEAKYTDIRNNVLYNLLLPLAFGVFVVLGVSVVVARRLSRPINRLVEGAQRLTSGELEHRVRGVPSSRELAQLHEHFNHMADAIQTRDAKLRHTNDELQRVNRNYMEILGFVSHEIKNALGNLIGSASLLHNEKLGPVNKRQKDMLAIFLRNSERIRDMIRNYLDLSRVEKGELQAQKRWSEFNETILEPVLPEITPAAQSKGMQLDNAVPDRFQIYADPDLLKVVMVNLLTNAVKYGKEGGTIRVNAEESDEEWLVGVWNEGEGIPEEQIPNLFNKFSRLDTDVSSHGQGSGLGLYITKEFIEQQGGKIWVESRHGEWAWFQFRLPRPADNILES